MGLFKLWICYLLFPPPLITDGICCMFAFTLPDSCSDLHSEVNSCCNCSLVPCMRAPLFGVCFSDLWCAVMTLWVNCPSLLLLLPWTRPSPPSAGGYFHRRWAPASASLLIVSRTGGLNAPDISCTEVTFPCIMVAE